MNINSLRYFLVASQELNISRAAKQLYITQQSLSEQIVRLEQEYGVKLFDRTPKLQLTHAGLRFQKKAEEILHLNNQLKAEMIDISRKYIGTLYIGATPTQGRLFISDAVQQFCSNFPKMSIEIEINNSAQLIESVKKHTCDVSFCFIKNDIPNVNIEPIIQFQEHMCIMVAENLAKKHCDSNALSEGKISLSELADLPFINFPVGAIQRNQAENCMNSLKLTPHNTIITSDLEMAARFCSCGIGAFICSERYANYFVYNHSLMQNLYRIELNYPSEKLQFSAIYRSQEYLSDPAIAFMDTVKKTVWSLPPSPSNIIPLLLV